MHFSLVINSRKGFVNMCCRKYRGFTLIEILVVVAIISLLVSIGIGAMGSVQKGIDQSTARTACEKIESAISSYYENYKRFPLELVALDSTLVPHSNMNAEIIYQLTNDNLSRDAALNLSKTETFPEGTGTTKDLTINTVATTVNLMTDPWGNPYHISIWRSTEGLTAADKLKRLWKEGSLRSYTNYQAKRYEIEVYSFGVDGVDTQGWGSGETRVDADWPTAAPLDHDDCSAHQE